MFGIECSDRNLVIVGHNQDIDEAWIVKTDNYGNELWNKMFSEYVVFDSIVEALNGNYVVIARKSDGKYIIEIDQNGIEQWNSKLFERGIVSDIIKAHYGGYVIGRSSLVSDSYDASLIKTDISGNIEWERFYNAELYDSVDKIGITNEGGYILIGDQASRSSSLFGRSGMLIITDNNGRMINEESRIYKSKSRSGLFNDGIQTEDGGFLIVGYVYNGGTYGWDFWVVKTDTHGLVH